MKVKELIEELERFDSSASIFISTPVRRYIVKDIGLLEIGMQRYPQIYVSNIYNEII